MDKRSRSKLVSAETGAGAPFRPSPAKTTFTGTTTAYSNDGTNPAILITTASHDSIEISQETYDPGLLKRTEISAEHLRVTQRLWLCSPKLLPCEPSFGTGRRFLLTR